MSARTSSGRDRATAGGHARYLRQRWDARARRTAAQQWEHSDALLCWRAGTRSTRVAQAVRRGCCATGHGLVLLLPQERQVVVDIHPDPAAVRDVCPDAVHRRAEPDNHRAARHDGLGGAERGERAGGVAPAVAACARRGGSELCCELSICQQAYCRADRGRCESPAPRENAVSEKQALRAAIRPDTHPVFRGEIREGPHRRNLHLHVPEIVREGAAVAVQRLRLLAGTDVDDLAARKVLGQPKRCKLAHAFLLECSYNRLELA
jgi:hypothetical protein